MMFKVKKQSSCKPTWTLVAKVSPLFSKILIMDEVHCFHF